MDISKLKPAAQLDFVLNKINELSIETKWRDFEMFSKDVLGHEMGLDEYRKSQNILSMCILKLEQDKNILVIRTDRGDKPGAYYQVSMNGFFLLEGKGYVRKFIVEYSQAVLKWTISIIVCVATFGAMIFSCKQTDLQNRQVTLQEKAQLQEEVSKLLVKQLKKQQSQIEHLSKRVCPQPTVVVKNYIRTK